MKMLSRHKIFMQPTRSNSCFRCSLAKPQRKYSKQELHCIYRQNSNFDTQKEKKKLNSERKQNNILLNLVTHLTRTFGWQKKLEEANEAVECRERKCYSIDRSHLYHETKICFLKALNIL